MFKQHNPKITAILIITLLIAGTFCYVQYLINKPLKILKNYTIPKEFIYDNTKIALAWTDENEGETLIIQSDKKEYNGFSSVDVYFSITNISKRDQDMDVVVWVGSEKVKVKNIEKLNENQKTTSNEMVLSASAGASAGIVNLDYSIADKKSLSSPDKNTLKDVEAPGVEPGRSGLTIPTSQPTAPTSNLLYNNSELAPNLNRKDIKNFETGYTANDQIESGKTNYYKATIKYPPMSKGEFFIEAFGHSVGTGHALFLQNDKMAYGHLDPWYSSNWNYKREITINSSQIATTTDNFPVLATTTLDDLKTTTNGGKVGNDNGYDIIFVDDDDSTLLNFEREKYASTTGEIVYWIKTDISSTTDKTIYMYYGNAGAANQATTTGVWDDNFVMVQHLQETPDNTADQIKDSTSNANDGQTVTMASDDQVAGQIDGSLDFDGGSDYIRTPTINLGSSFSLSFWMKPDLLYDYGDPLSAGIDDFHLSFVTYADGHMNYILGNGSSWGNAINPGAGTFISGNWYHVVGMYDGSNTELFIDGVSKGTVSNIGYSLNYFFTIGSRRPGIYEFNGPIDEVRISNIARTAGWIETEYNNQSDAGSFITIGAEMSNNWYSTNWKYRRQIDINSSQIATTTSDFPILATTTLDDLKTTANNGKVESENGYDIIFVNFLGNTLLNFEKEKYASTTGEIVYWIKTDISSTTDKKIYMYYGNSSATDQSTTTGVWDDNYKGVWHLAETDIDNDAGDIKDSTANANNGTTYNMNTDDQVTGQINGSLDFNGTDNYINIGNAYNGVKTISFWLKPDDDTDRMILDIDATDYIQINTNSKIEPISFTSPIIYVDGTIASSTDTNWHYAVITDTTGVNASAMNISKVASSYFDGIIDEVRVSSIVRHAGWIETEYNNQSNASSFLTINAEESLKLVITTSAKTLTAGTESTAFTVQTQDLSSNPINMGSDTTVNLSSDSSLYSFASTTGGTEISSVTIPSGSNSVNFYYTDHKVGLPTITITATNLVSDTQQQTVQARDPSWYNRTYQYRRKITLEADQIATTTDAFPALAIITLDDLKTTANGGKVGNDNGYDIIFVDDDDSTLLNFEKEKYVNTTGEIVYWIKTDISSTIDKTIYMYYGNSGASDLATTTGVWDDNFVMVQHLQETDIDGGAGDIKDSTKYVNNGTTVNMNTADQVAGQIDGSFDFDGSNDHVSIGTQINMASWPAVSAGAWVKYDSSGTDEHTIISNWGGEDTDGRIILRLEPSNDTVEAFVCTESNSELGGSFLDLILTPNQLHFVKMTFDTTSGLQVYLDGVKSSTSYSSATGLESGISAVLRIGYSIHHFNTSDWLTGLIDEVRISNIARSAGWIETEYNNQNDIGSFMTIGEELDEMGILDISTDPKVIIAGTESTAFTVQANYDVAANTIVNLSSDSTGAYHFAATPGGAEVSSVTIPSGTSSVYFYYTDYAAGSPTIIVAATNFVSDDQQQMIKGVWQNTSYQCRRQITINSSQIATTTSAFPVLATTTLTNLKTVANGGYIQNDSGYDIIFIDDDNSTVLNYEREKYASTTGEIVYWIKTDISSTTNKIIYMYYGNASASDLATTTGVWDDNFVGVWHLAHDGVATTTYPDFFDSTQYSKDGSSANMNSDDLITAWINGGLDFDGTDDYISIGNAYDGVKTISFWLKPDDATDRMILDIDGTDYIQINANGKIEPISFTSPIIYVDGTVASSTDTNWHYTVVTDTTGVNASAMNISKVSTSYFDGAMDEIRISSTVRTAGWIETEYNNQVDVESFMTFGAEVCLPVPATRSGGEDVKTMIKGGVRFKGGARF